MYLFCSLCTGISKNKWKKLLKKQNRNPLKKQKEAQKCKEENATPSLWHELKREATVEEPLPFIDGFKALNYDYEQAASLLKEAAKKNAQLMVDQFQVKAVLHDFKCASKEKVFLRLRSLPLRRVGDSSEITCQVPADFLRLKALYKLRPYNVEVVEAQVQISFDQGNPHQLLGLRVVPIFMPLPHRPSNDGSFAPFNCRSEDGWKPGEVDLCNCQDSPRDFPCQWLRRRVAEAKKRGDAQPYFLGQRLRQEGGDELRCVEWKLGGQWVQKEDDKEHKWGGPEEVCKYVVGFMNSCGGVLKYGIADKTGEVKGVIVDANKFDDQFQKVDKLLKGLFDYYHIVRVPIKGGKPLPEGQELCIVEVHVKEHESVATLLDKERKEYTYVRGDKSTHEITDQTELAKFKERRWKERWVLREEELEKRVLQKMEGGGRVSAEKVQAFLERHATSVRTFQDSFPMYIPLRCQLTQSSMAETYDLEETVCNFLESKEAKSLLLLGDSGAGYPASIDNEEECT